MWWESPTPTTFLVFGWRIQKAGFSHKLSLRRRARLAGAEFGASRNESARLQAVHPIDLIICARTQSRKEPNGMRWSTVLDHSTGQVTQRVTHPSSPV